jgi:predicted RNase H-like HicB family nuclease
MEQVMIFTLTVHGEFDPETNLYVGLIPGIPGAHTQGATLDELQQNLQEVLALCLEKNPDAANVMPRLIAIQQVEVV